MPNITLETRRESYERILEELGDRQKQCISHLKLLGGRATANELAMSVFQAGLTRFFNRNYVHPRLNELVEMGLVEVIGKVQCEHTGRTVSVYSIKEG